MRCFAILITSALLFISTSLDAQAIDPAKVDRVKLKIGDTTDKFTGLRKIGPGSGLNLENTGWLTTLALTPAILVSEDKPPIFYVGVYYSGYGWIFLNGKAYFLIDGKRFTASGNDSSSHREVSVCSGAAGCINEELERLPISRELAYAIANAKDAEMKATGSQGSLVGRLNAKHVAYFREIIRQYEALGGQYLGTGETPPLAPAAEQCLACKDIGHPAN